MSALESSNKLKVVLVHVDEVPDGIGARFKKAVELVASGLTMGFYAVALHFGRESVQLHNSPAQGSAHSHDLNFPVIFWEFDLQSDFLAQTPSPLSRTLLWGAPLAAVALTAADGAPQFNCLTFEEPGPAVGARRKVADDAAWKFHQREPLKPNDLERLFASVRAFVRAGEVLDLRRETLCGFGDDAFHLAVHLRRGDVGLDAHYAAPQQMRPAGFRKWLCDLATAVAPANISARGEALKLRLHVYTEAEGLSRAKLRSAGGGAPPGFAFPPADGDDVEPTYHHAGLLASPAGCAGVAQEVHFVVNDNPGDAMLCMARADALVTSLSSLSWAAAVASDAPVFHPDPRQLKHVSPPTHWDLREQYLDWAPNWFTMDAVQRQPDAVRAVFGRSRG